MIRICHMTSSHMQGDNRVFRKECCTLARAGYEVYFVVPGQSGECEGVHIVGTGAKSASRLKRFTTMAKRTYTIARELDCDVYHFHDTELLPYGLKLAKQGKKVIFDSHECYPLLIEEKEYIPSFLRGLVAWVYRSYESYVAKHLDAVVTPAAIEGKNMFTGRCRRSVLVDNLPELKSFPTELPPLRDAENTVGYVGRLSESRGITQLVRACHKAGARLRLAGPVPPEYMAELQKMPEYACVEYAGVLPYEQVPEFCRGFSVGLCVLMNIGQYNKMDNLATKIYEYMGMGLPVIMTDTRPARKLLEEYACGMCVDPDDVDDIARAIRRLLDDPQQARCMGENGRRAVMEKYNWQNEEKKLLSLYSILIDDATM